MVAKVGFIGLGTMGKPMATNVLKGGFDLMVHDVRQEPMQELAGLGAKLARSAGAVGEHADVIEIAVATDAQVESVILGEEGVLAGARPGAVVAIHSTVHPRTVKRVAEQAETKGVRILDAQMSGGSQGAEAQRLCFMVGGEPADLATCRPVLEASGAVVFHVGPQGTGAAVKLAQQVIIVGTMIAVAEGMLLAKEAGIQQETLADIINASVGPRQVWDNWLDRFSRLDKARVDGLYEGLVPALDLAHQLGVSLPNLAVVQQLLSVRIPAD